MATILLEDGTKIQAQSFGAQGETFGEIVFNTSMEGYQEILSDSSSINQIVVMTYPEIGNYGINDDDFNSDNSKIKALVVKEYSKIYSHHKAKKTLAQYLQEKGIIGVFGVDTRALAKKIRDCGTMNCFISSNDLSDEQTQEKLNETKNYKPNPNAVLEVTTKEKYKLGENNEIKVAVIDLGAKKGMLKSLVNRGCELTIMPADTQANEILENNFDCVFLTNGPDDPQNCTTQLEVLKNLIGKIPIFGVGLGFELLAIISGAKTYKLKYGHRGANHPVKDLKTQKVLMTSQNHSYSVDVSTMSEIMDPTYKNLNDETIEGFEIESLKVHGVQFCPECAPCVCDTGEIFDNWVELMKKYKKARV